MEKVLNNLGGDMPQAKLDSIKLAWMTRYGMPESAWNDFQPVNTAVEYTNSIDDSELEHPLCPSWEEMGLRYRARSKYHQNQYEKYGMTPTGLKNREDAEFYHGLSEHCFDVHRKIIRNIQGRG